MGRVGHAKRVLAFLRQREEAGQVRDYLVDEGGGDRRVLEVEEADVDKRVLQLLDEGGAGGGRGEEVVVERRDSREVGCGGHGQVSVGGGCGTTSAYCTVIFRASVMDDAIMGKEVVRR